MVSQQGLPGGGLMPTDKQWKLIWGAWAAYFAVAEYYALKSKNPKAPLSYFLRKTLGVPHTVAHRRAGRIALGGGVVWLIEHLYQAQKEE